MTALPKCKYFDEEALKCTIADLIPSHPEYCRENPDLCEAYKYAIERGEDKAIKKYRRR
ncbi:MAG: hypothetical protein NDF55_10860 [archaeon GB-1867-005]|nr:hypothetical protein [Candidatus Culexmicrobium cathedralense]